MSFKFSDASLYVLFSHLLYLIFEHTLDFITHGFSAGIAEMDTHLVGSLADFLYQRGGVLRRSGRGGVCGLHGTGFFAHGAPFSGRGCAVQQKISRVYGSQCPSPPVWLHPHFPPGSSSRQRESGHTVPGYGHRYWHGPSQAGPLVPPASGLW